MENISNDTVLLLKKYNIIPIIFNINEKLTNLKFNEDDINYLINNNDLGKLFLFNISECVKFVYLDPDILILKNIDELFTFENNNIYMVPNTFLNEESQVMMFKNKFNSSIIISNYNINLFDQLFSLLFKNISEIKKNSVDIFSYLIYNITNEIKILNLAYNIYPHIIESAKIQNIIQEPNIIKYLDVGKPCDILELSLVEYDFEEDIVKNYYKKWIDMYFEMILYYHFIKNDSTITYN